MDKFTLKNPSYMKNNQIYTYKFLSFFVFKGKAYHIGARVKLTGAGQHSMRHAHNGSEFIVTQYYFENERLKYEIKAIKDKKINYGFGGYVDSVFESVVEKVLDSPVTEDNQKYIDYLNYYQMQFLNENFTSEEKENIKYANSNFIDVEELDHNLPDKIKRVESAKREACNVHKDWEYPEIMIGWVVLIVFCVLMGVFNRPMDQFILRMIGVVCFFMWREKQILKG